MSLGDNIAAGAQSILDTLTETKYQYPPEALNMPSGVYNCDCNGFVGYVLQQIAPNHFQIVEDANIESGPWPRAFSYYDFFASLTPESTGGWHRIDFLEDAQPGDIIAWREKTIEVNQDTGHVMIVAQPPTPDPSGDFQVWVYDSAAYPHFEDTRTTGAFPTGVGTGYITFKVDAEGRPNASIFGPTLPEATFLQIAVGRGEPI